MFLVRFLSWILKRILSLGAWLAMLVPRIILHIPKDLMGLPRRIRRVRLINKIWTIIIKILNLAATGFSLFLTVEPIIQRFQDDTNE